MTNAHVDHLVQVSPRGQVTLPQSFRKALGLRPGDTLVVDMEGGRIVLRPAVVVPVEVYTDERVREFEESSEMTSEELAAARARWGMSVA